MTTATESLIDAAQDTEDRILAILGDSNFVGFGASLDTATGWRLPLQRVLSGEGIRFRMVGKGLGALNGTGTSSGKFPSVDDFHDAPIFVLRDGRNNGYTGHRISFTAPVTNIDISTNVITAPGNLLTAGDPIVLTSTREMPIFATTQPIFYACNIGIAGAGTFQAAKYEGSTTAEDITYAGSGDITLNQGLAEMFPSIAESWDVAPTDIIVGGGTNDIANLVGLGVSAASALATLKSREVRYQAAISAAAKSAAANKYRWGILPFFPGAANQATCAAVVAEFNAWLVTRVKEIGNKWMFVNPGEKLTAANMSSDGVHPIRTGFEIMADAGARPIVQVSGGGKASRRVPRDFVRRPSQACVELRATTDRVTLPAQSGLNPGANSFFFAIWFMPFETKTGTNVIVQQENPYNDGCMLTMTNSNFQVYWKSAGAAIPSSSYTAVAKRFRWHRLLVFCDAVRQEIALFCNGRLVQRTPTSAAAITSSDGWAIGAFAALNSAPGLYQGFLMGHGADRSIESARQTAEDDYFGAKEPDGLTAKFDLSAGSGTTIAGAVSGSSAGTLAVTTGGWVANGLYMLPCNFGYVKPQYVQRVANVTAAYTAAPGELVKYDASSAGFILTVPGGAALGVESISLAEMTGSTNVVTVTPATGTIDGAANLPVSAAGARTRIAANGANLITVA